MTDHLGSQQDPHRRHQYGTGGPALPVDPDRTQVLGPSAQPPYRSAHYQIPAWVTPTGPAASGRSTGRIVAAVVGVLAIAGIATAITVSSHARAQATPAGLVATSSSAPRPSTTPSPDLTTAAPTTASAGTERSGSPGPTGRVQPVPTDDETYPADTYLPAPCPEDVCPPQTQPSENVPTTLAGGDGTQGPGPIAGQTNNIIAAAMNWMDARNAGDGNRVLQLGCLDDVDAVNAGQMNPAGLSGSSTVRPTGTIVPFGTHNLAAYVESSQVDLHDGHSGTTKLPIIWENHDWHICYYPGARTQAIADLG